MDETALQKLRTRIQGLRAKTLENGCTEAEALLAAGKVAELIDRYDLTLGDVEIRAARCERRVYANARNTAAGLLMSTSTRIGLFVPRVSVSELQRYGYQWYLGDMEFRAGGTVRLEHWVGGAGNGNISDCRMCRAFCTPHKACDQSRAVMARGWRTYRADYARTKAGCHCPRVSARSTGRPPAG